jgi:hypothetical protein
VRLELRPARKVELARDDQQSVGAGELGELRGARSRRGQARVELVDDLGRAEIAGADCSLERLGAVLQGQAISARTRNYALDLSRTSDLACSLATCDLVPQSAG